MSSLDYKEAKILVIDDADFSRELVRQVLNTIGIRHVTAVADGIEGLQAAKETKPDMIILDLLMPNMDGYEFLQQIKRMRGYEDIPIMVQTGLADAEKRAKAFQYGATDLLIKPLNASELIARTVTHIEKSRLLSALKDYQNRIKSELESAREMQMSLLPDEMDIDLLEAAHPLRVASFFSPSSELSGDFWGCQPISEDEVALFMVDFTGHGIMAALNTFRLHTLIKTEMPPTSDPGDYMSRLNKKLHELLLEQHFATMFYGVINHKEQKLSYSVAASTNPVLLRKTLTGTSEVTVLDGSGLPLGVLKGTEYETKTVPFYTGDVLFCYSDALVEAEDIDGNMYSEERVLEHVRETHLAEIESTIPDIAKIQNQILRRFFTATGNREMSDDLTTMLVTCTGCTL